MYFYPRVLDGIELELSVDNPGFGDLHLRVIDGPVTPWEHAFAGPSAGRLLTTVTALALEQAPPSEPVRLPAWLSTAAAARALLPALQSAVILAAADTDRHERLFPDPEAAAAPPLCARCSHGTEFAAVETTSSWCQEYGHQPFGQNGRTWAKARRLYGAEKRWETR